jgi:hypothetical protein
MVARPTSSSPSGAVLRGGRPDPDGPPLEALPSGRRVRRLLERRAERTRRVQVWDTAFLRAGPPKK